MRIGIPRALLYYKYYPFWKRFLEGLGGEVVTSDKTTQKILQGGIKCVTDETCLSVKVFCGHVLNLIEKGIDLLFIPRIESVEKGHFVCTKFLGLPDIVRNCIKDHPPILSPDIDFNRRSLYRSMFSVGWQITKSPIRIHISYLEADKRQRKFEKTLKQTETPQDIIDLLNKERITKTESKGDLKIALIGHAYNIYDEFINLGMIKKLQQLNVNVIIEEMAPKKEIFALASEASKDIYWTYGKEILGASLYYARNGIDGIIFVSTFPCGPDSLIVEYAIRHIQGRVPILSLILDEHQGDAGIVTRLESFVDLVRIKKRSMSD